MGYLILETAKPKKKSSKTGKKFRQNRKLHSLSKQENPKTTLDNKTEKPISFLSFMERSDRQKTDIIFYEKQKRDAKKRKIRKPKRTPKPKNRSLLAQKPRKNCQNRKTENPNLI